MPQIMLRVDSSDLKKLDEFCWRSKTSLGDVLAIGIADALKVHTPNHEKHYSINKGGEMDL